MKLTLIAALAASMTASSAFAFDANFSTNMSATVTDSTTVTSYDVSSNVSQDFGNFTGIAGLTYDLSKTDVSKFYIGGSFGNTALTYGDQYGAFDFDGGLTKIKGTVLPSETVSRNLVLTRPSFGVSLDVTGNEVNDVQASYNVPAFNGVNLTTGLKYTVATEQTTLAVKADTKVGEVAVGAILAYNDSFAGEVNAGYLGSRAFLSFDETGLDTLGAGYDFNVSENAALYVEAGRNLNTDEDKFVVGASVKF